MEQPDIINRLDRIEKTLRYIQKNMIDADTLVTEEEKKMLNESIEHEKAGKLVSLEAIKNVRNKTR